MARGAKTTTPLLLLTGASSPSFDLFLNANPESAPAVLAALPNAKVEGAAAVSLPPEGNDVAVVAPKVKPPLWGLLMADVAADPKMAEIEHITITLRVPSDPQFVNKLSTPS